MPEITQADIAAVQRLKEHQGKCPDEATVTTMLQVAFAAHRTAAAEAAKDEATRAEREKWMAACSRVSRDSARQESDETFHEGRMTACSAIVQLATAGNDTANKEPRR
jgi:hypothetical protein